MQLIRLCQERQGQRQIQDKILMVQLIRLYRGREIQRQRRIQDKISMVQQIRLCLRLSKIALKNKKRGKAEISLFDKCNCKKFERLVQSQIPLLRSNICIPVVYDCSDTARCYHSECILLHFLRSLKS